MKKPPATIQVADLLFAVVPLSPNSSEASEKYGVTDLQSSTIHYAENQTDDRLRNTILHEVFHACWNRANLKDDDREERIVTGLANVFIQVLQDNPEWVKWIKVTS